MIDTGVVRATLWLSAPFNLVAAAILAFPASSPAQLVGVPADTPILYRALCGFLVALFGVTYAWLARQIQIQRTFLAFCAIGKSGVFFVALVLWLAAEASGRLLLLAGGDFVLAAVWFAWLAGEAAPHARR